MKTLADLTPMLAPKSIAIFGASDNPTSIGGRVVRLLQKFRYPGHVWPVNPQREEVAGMRCYRGADQLPGAADLAVFAIAADAIADTVVQCARAGIRNGIALASGFAEAGASGVERQTQLVEACKQGGFNLCGPNCVGIVNTWQPMIGTFTAALVEADKLLQGGISMVSQSGGTMATTQTLANRAGGAFRYLVSTGNEAVLQASDFISALAEDEPTRVIAVYLEGCHDGPSLIAALQKAREAGKPVVLLKAGMNPDSARAATAHTGVLAGEGRVWRAIFRETGVIPVGTHAELIDVALYLDAHASRMPRSRNTAIIVFGGGYGVLSADLCAANDLKLPPLTPESGAKLAPLVPPMASLANPLDLTPQAISHPDWLKRFPQALDAIAADPGIDILFFQLGAMGAPTEKVVSIICELLLRTDKAVVIAWPLGTQSYLQRLTDAGIYVFSESPKALRALDKVITFREQAQVSAPAARAAAPADFDWLGHVPRALADTVISEHECHRMLAAAGICVAAGELATSSAQALAIARNIGYPVAMKGISPKVTHRAAAGLVALDLRTDAEVEDAYVRLGHNAEIIGARLDGIYVQHMEGGRLEVLVSAFRDPIFGIMITCGAGGNLTELIDDVALARAPLTRQGALALLLQLRLIQRAARIDREAQIDALADFLVQFSCLAAGIPWRRFVLEVNPVKWEKKRVAAVDGLLLIQQP